jgi:hypothetical protein
MARVALVVLLLVGATACVPLSDSYRVTTGRVTPEGRLIFYEWKPQEGAPRRHAALHGDYGMMVFYDNWAKGPQRVRYELYFQESRRIIKTTRLERFKLELSKIPEGSVLDWYNTCQAGTYYGLPIETMTEIEEACKQHGVVLRRGPVYGGPSENMICTCS